MGFSSQIIEWYANHHRRLPWRETRDPYKIWVSEVILQQTRVDQGLGYYCRFIDKFPDIRSLATAQEEEVLKAWQGLGYYSRARNMHQAARRVMQIHNGVFPSSYEQIISLKGIGEYSASAIASFAFDLPYAVMDGNVIRVISRLNGITDPVNSTITRNRIKEIMDLEIDRKRPGLFNQAVMEFGALQCTPQDPGCGKCPLQVSCIAWNTGNVQKIPVKDKKSPVRDRFFHYLVFIMKENDRIYTLLSKRTGNDIWRNLYEFPMIEADRMLEWREVTELPEWKETISSGGSELVCESSIFTHILSHRKLYARYFLIACKALPDGFLKVSQSELPGFPVPKLMEKIITQTNITFLDLKD
jgi:A/G-specific adenine glycosylase